MSTDLDICNIALSLIGADSITALTEASTEARWCNTNYQPLRDTLLSEHGWQFAEEQLVLTGATASPWGDGYLYPIPSDAVHIYRVYEDVSGDYKEQAKWRRLGKNILADIDGTLYAIGVLNSTTEDDFPPAFVQALAARLAVEMTVPLTRSTMMLELQITLYNEKLTAALATDGSEARSERTRVTHLSGARYSQGPLS